MRNCNKCGKIFASSGSLLCSECFETEEEQFQIVKKYLSGHRGASATKVSKETGVPVEVVTEFVRRGHLVGTGFENNNDARCAICKNPVARGRICTECQRALSGSQLGSLDSDQRFASQGPNVSIQKEKPKAGEQMYTIDLIRRRRR